MTNPAVVNNAPDPDESILEKVQKKRAKGALESWCKEGGDIFHSFRNFVITGVFAEGFRNAQIAYKAELTSINSLLLISFYKITLVSNQTSNFDEFPSNISICGVFATGRRHVRNLTVIASSKNIEHTGFFKKDL